MNDKLKIIQEKTTPILSKYSVTYAGVFGSFACGDDRPESDVDILVTLDKEKPIGLYEFVGLEFDLEEVLGKKVDLVSSGGVNKYIRPFMQKDLISIYER